MLSSSSAIQDVDIALALKIKVLKVQKPISIGGIASG